MNQNNGSHDSSFRDISYTGVIYVIHRATEYGYHPHHPDWVNLGQGAPEINELPGGMPRLSSMLIDLDEHEYTPVAGELALRQKVADVYNSMYRKHHQSKYTYKNVCISGGGRVGLTRVIASLGNINLGHFLPDYTAYEEILSSFKAFVPIPILLDPKNSFRMSIEQMEQEILGRGLKALLLSNPSNPTGRVIQGDELKGLVDLGYKHECTLILDEFYSHYVYSNENHPSIISAAQFIEDVNQNSVIIIDGLTKNWRYPGWRISWTLGPEKVIEILSSVGSFLDGGANHPLQHEAIPLLEPDYIYQETQAIQNHFRKKRDYLLKNLLALDFEIAVEPEGTFYIWANVQKLPPPLNNGFSFFEACLKEQVIVVPGIFFDVNPEKRRKNARYDQYIRISFGAEMSALEQGVAAIERTIQKAKASNFSKGL